MKYKQAMLAVGLVIATVAFTKVVFGEPSQPTITYLQKFEIMDHSPLISIRGSYLSGRDIQVIALDCYLDQNRCNETSVFITKDGITGIVSPKEFKIIEQSPTRIVARYDGLAAFHIYTIDLATKKVTSKNESNSNPSDVAIYELVDGNKVLEEYSSN